MNLNAYNFQDVSNWKDLGPKFILQVFRDYKYINRLYQQSSSSESIRVIRTTTDSNMITEIHTPTTLLSEKDDYLPQLYDKQTSIIENQLFSQSNDKPSHQQHTLNNDDTQYPTTGSEEQSVSVHVDNNSKSVNKDNLHCEAADENVQALEFLKDFYPILLLILSHTMTFDKDNDGMIENSGFPDQTYDIWKGFLLDLHMNSPSFDISNISLY